MLIYLHNYSAQTGMTVCSPKILKPLIPFAQNANCPPVLFVHSLSIVEAENLDWCLFLVSEQSLIK